MNTFSKFSHEEFKRWVRFKIPELNIQNVDTCFNTRLYVFITSYWKIQNNSEFICLLQSFQHSSDNRGKPEACLSVESLRPPEQSRLQDEPPSSQWVHKTVCIPTSSQHCMLVLIGITDLGVVDFISRTLLGTIHLRGHWSTVYFNFILSQYFHPTVQFVQKGWLVTVSQGNSFLQRFFGTELRFEVRNVSPLWKSVCNL